MDDAQNQVLALRRMSRMDRCEKLNNLSASDALSDKLTLLYLINDRSSSLRQEVIDLLVHIGSPLAQIGARVAITDSSPLMRDRAAVALGIVGNRHDVYLLRKLLDDYSWNVRSSAALSLGLLKGDAAYAALEKSLTKEKNPIVRRDIADALSNHGDKAIAPLIQALKDEVDNNARVGLFFALYKLGRRQFLQPFLELLDDPVDLTRHQVINLIVTLVPNMHYEDLAEVIRTLKIALKQENNPGIKKDAEIALDAVLTRQDN